MGKMVEVVETKAALSNGTASCGMGSQGIVTGSAGLRTRVYGGCVTVSALAEATGGISGGSLVRNDNK